MDNHYFYILLTLFLFLIVEIFSAKICLSIKSQKWFSRQSLHTYFCILRSKVNDFRKDISFWVSRGSQGNNLIRNHLNSLTNLLLQKKNFGKFSLYNPSQKGFRKFEEIVPICIFIPFYFCYCKSSSAEIFITGIQRKLGLTLEKNDWDLTGKAINLDFRR